MSEATISKYQRIALVIMGLSEETAASVLKEFDRAEMSKIAEEMSKLRGLNFNTAREVIQGFFEAYRDHSGIRGASQDYMSKTLNIALGNNIARGMIARLYGDDLKNKMKMLQWVEASSLANFISSEHPELQAMFLSLLEPHLASNVLHTLPEQIHDDLVLRLASLKEISPTTSKELNELIERCIEHFSSSASTKIAGAKQAAEIINRYSGDRTNLMQMIRLSNDVLADDIEQNMYDFSLISRQKTETLDKIIQIIPIEQWAIALKGADVDVVRAIRGVMPKRLVDNLDQAMNEAGAVAITRVQEERDEIIQMIRKLNNTGEIELVLFEEPTVS